VPRQSAAPVFESPIPVPGDRAPEQRGPEQRRPEQRDPEQRDPEQRAPGQHAPGQHAPAATAPAPIAAPTAQRSVAMIDADRWLELVAASPLRGPARELASHAGFVGHDGEVLRLSLAPADEHLKAPALVKMLADALAPSLGASPQVRFEAAATPGETFHERSSRERDARQLAAEQAFVDDPGVQRLVARHGARVVPDSIRPFDEA
jgi:DNA polymerase-3 subunit gamma/tau